MKTKHEYYKKQQIRHDEIYSKATYLILQKHDNPATDYWAELEVKRLFDTVVKIGKIDPTSVLRIHVPACGSGFNLRSLAEYFTFSQLYLSEIAYEGLMTANKRVVVNHFDQPISFVQANSEMLPFKDNFFDVTLCIHSLHHFGNPKNGLDEFLRSSRIVGLVEPIDSKMVKILQLLGIIKTEEDNGCIVFRFSKKWLREKFQHKSLFYSSYLHKFHPLFFKIVLPFFMGKVGLDIFKMIYGSLNYLSLPLHTKAVIVLK